MSDYSIQQYCRFVRERHDYRIYAFCLFVDATREVLSRIVEVEYTLDPSFPEPVRVSQDAEQAFPLQSEAWGGFTTHVRIRERGVLGLVQKITRIEYRLHLQEDGWPMGKPLLDADLSTDSERLIYGALLDDSKWEWRKLPTLARRARLSVEDARKTLIDLKQKGAVRRALHAHFIDREELWGATSVVGLAPKPR